MTAKYRPGTQEEIDGINAVITEVGDLLQTMQAEQRISTSTIINALIRVLCNGAIELNISISDLTEILRTMYEDRVGQPTTGAAYN